MNQNSGRPFDLGQRRTPGDPFGRVFWRVRPARALHTCRGCVRLGLRIGPAVIRRRYAAQPTCRACPPTSAGADQGRHRLL